MTKEDSANFILVRSKDSRDATARLHSEPLVRAFALEDQVRFEVVNPSIEKLCIEPGCWLIFHYDDSVATNSVRNTKLSGENVKCVCLAADIYNYEEYISLDRFVDVFLVPTRLHKLMLSAQLSSPVYVLGEAADSVAALNFDPSKVGQISISEKPKLLWFGYPESFDKSMLPLIPVLDRNRESGVIDRMDIVTDLDKFHDGGHFGTRQYSIDNFGAVLAEYNYAILSHLSLDLSVNTLIKSPNKAVTALMGGVIPLATDTPNYGELFRYLGLQDFLFSSPLDLHKLLGRLDPKRDAELVYKSDVIPKLRSLCSDTQLMTNFKTAVRCFTEEDHSLVQSLRSFKPSRLVPNRHGARLAKAFRSLLSSR